MNHWWFWITFVWVCLLMRAQVKASSSLALHFTLWPKVSHEPRAHQLAGWPTSPSTMLRLWCMSPAWLLHVTRLALCACWGSKLRSSRVSSKHSTHSATRLLLNIVVLFSTRRFRQTFQPASIFSSSADFPKPSLSFSILGLSYLCWSQCKNEVFFKYLYSFCFVTYCFLK